MDKMAFRSAAKAKILHFGERMASNRVGSVLRLDEIDFSRNQLRAFGAQTALTLAMVTAVTVVLFAIDEFVDLRHEIVFYFIPIMIAMLRWNVVQGFIAAATAAIFARVFFYGPILSFYFTNPKRLVGFGFFVVALIIIGYLAANLRHARRASSVPIVPLRANTDPEPVVKSKAAEASFADRAPTVPERVKDFLVAAEGKMYCDSCIQENLGLKWRQQVQLITATLGVTGEFQRDLAQCCGCEEEKQATQAIA
jgi:hypothetical protein